MLGRFLFLQKRPHLEQETGATRIERGDQSGRGQPNQFDAASVLPANLAHMRMGIRYCMNEHHPFIAPNDTAQLPPATPTSHGPWVRSCMEMEDTDTGTQ